MSLIRPTLARLLPLVGLCAGCSAPARHAHRPLPSPELRRDAAALRPFGGEPRGYTPLSYEVSGRFAWDAHALQATETVVVKPDTPTLAKLVLDSAVTEVTAVQDEHGAALPFVVDAEAGTLTVTLAPSATRADGTIAVRIEYRAEANAFVENQATTGITLHAVEPRPGDPSQARVVYTFAEPLGTAQWMPCDDVPAARARFKLELALPADEDLVANGDRVADAVGADGLRHVRYETSYTLPTYLMAFAEGQLARTTKTAGRVPVSIWSRRDVPVDADGLGERVAQLVRAYEAKLGPYPFEKYDVILLPEMVDGEEHAGITFQEELNSSDPGLERTLSLTAHELGHQWFGDDVTIAGWDDLWFKEGMATLLAKNALGQDEDAAARGRLFAGHFLPKDGEAVRDKALAPADKYTSGPYDRAAWLYTQLRAAAGEEAFWGVLRGILKDHAYGAVTSEEVLAAFRPAVGEDVYAKAVKALDAHALPALTLAAEPAGGVTLSLADADGALLLPLSVATVDAAGKRTAATLAAGGQLTVAAGDRVEVEPREVHPARSFVRQDGAYDTVLGPRLAPRTDGELAALVAGPTNPLVDALRSAEGWKLTAASFTTAYAAVTSEEAKGLLLRRACETAGAGGQKADTAWRQALETALQRLPVSGLTSDNLPAPNLTACVAAMGADYFAPRWAKLEAAPTTREVKVGELDALGALGGLAPAKALEVWGGLVRQGASAGVRWAALGQLVRYLGGEAGFPAPTAAELPEWKAFLRETLAGTDVTDVSRIAATALARLKDDGALATFAGAVLRFDDPIYQKELVCDAAAAGGGDAAAWQSQVVANLGDLTKLETVVREVVETPAKCQVATH